MDLFHKKENWSKKRQEEKKDEEEWTSTRRRHWIQFESVYALWILLLLLLLSLPKAKAIARLIHPPSALWRILRPQRLIIISPFSRITLSSPPSQLSPSLNSSNSSPPGTYLPHFCIHSLKRSDLWYRSVLNSFELRS